MVTHTWIFLGFSYLHRILLPQFPLLQLHLLWLHRHQPPPRRHQPLPRHQRLPSELQGRDPVTIDQRRVSFSVPLFPSELIVLHHRLDQPRSKHPSTVTPEKLAVSRRDKFVESEHRLFPPQIPVWSASLVEVNRQETPISRIDYFVPEPALLVGPSDNTRIFRYLSNWLKAKEPWLHIVTHSVFGQGAIHQQWWRDYLNHEFLDEAANRVTETSKKKVQVFALFSALSPEDNIGVGRGETQFYGRPFMSLEQEQMCREIIWEVFEMGFRLELLELDKRICPSPLTPHERQASEYERLDRISRIFGSEGQIRIAALPNANLGLAAVDPIDRVPALEAFRRLLLRWPGVPQALSSPFSPSMSPGAIEDRERVAVGFYLQQFYIRSSRAAIVPHRFPL